MTVTRSDAELMVEIAGRDLAALRELYDRHAAWLAVRLRRRCNDAEVVADALQDTFVAVWDEAPRFRGDGEAAAWLWGIAVRRLVSRLRRRRDVAFLADLPSYAGPVAPAAEEQVLLSVEYGDLGTAMARLSPEMRAVMQAVVLDGLTTREAAKVLRVPENTVKTRLHRAKAHLRAGLAEVTP
ncbi:MAG: RNA polymerase sigma factor [Actinomycetota bacterium]|nr:RNA polymerase sigma factor [Actinomycetota bacterium]